MPLAFEKRIKKPSAWSSAKTCVRKQRPLIIGLAQRAFVEWPFAENLLGRNRVQEHFVVVS